MYRFLGSPCSVFYNHIRRVEACILECDHSSESMGVESPNLRFRRHEPPSHSTVGWHTPSLDNTSTNFTDLDIFVTHGWCLDTTLITFVTHLNPLFFLQIDELLSYQYPTTRWPDHAGSVFTNFDQDLTKLADPHGNSKTGSSSPI